MKILICDDDNLNLKLNRVMVEDFLEKRKIRHVEIIAVNYIDLDEDYRKLENLDIAVLDINLKDKVNGLTIAQVIKTKPICCIGFYYKL